MAKRFKGQYMRNIQVKNCFLKIALFLLLLIPPLSTLAADDKSAHQVNQNVGKGLSNPIPLTEQEQAWLARKHTVRVRISEFPPHMMTLPEPRGISVDYLKLIGKRFSINFKFIANESIRWKESVEDLEGERKWYDLLITMKRTPEREKKIAFTQDYLFAPWVIVNRTDSPYVSRMDDLNDKNVAVERGYVIEELIKEKYPRVKLVVVKNTLEALQTVASGSTDAYVGNLTVATYFIQNGGLYNLKIAAPTPFGNHDQAMGVRSDWPELVSIINKALMAMPDGEKNAISSHWFTVKYEYGVNTNKILIWIVGPIVTLTLLTVVTSIWNRRLKREIDCRREAEESLLKAKQQIAESEVELRTIIETEPECVKQLTADGAVLSMNRAGLDMIEADSLEQVLGRKISQLVLPKYRDAFIALTQKVFMGESCCLEFEIRGLKGGDRWLDTHAVPLKNSQGQIIALLGVTRDITGRKKLENDLQLVTREQKTVLDNSSVGITMVRNRVQVWANPAMSDIFGYSPEEISQVETRMFYASDEEYERFGAEAYPLLAKGLEYQTELQMKHKDGNLIWIHISGRAITPNNLTEGSVWIFENISQQKLMEAARKENEAMLRRSETKFSTIFQSSPDVIAISEKTTGRFLEVNDAFERIIGYSREEVIGRSALELGTWGSHELRQHMLEELADKKRLQNYQTRFRRKNGEIFPVLLSLELVEIDGVECFSISARDITEQEKIKEELLRSRDAAESATRAKSGFLANMSHEIRTPMNAITGMAYLVQQTDLDPQQREYVARIRSAADSLLGIINDILDFSKIEAGKMELESVIFDLHELFSSVQNIVAARAKDKNLNINFSISPEIPPVLIGDQLRLRQILNNLVSNAIKFTEKGSVLVTVTQSRENSRTDRIALTFSITDSGIGMDSEHLQHIFEPFIQADNSITRRYGGTGLGLSIVTRLLKLMGSTLEVVSTPEQGSTFTFTVEFGLPLELVLRTSHTPEDLRQMRVLVVDDSIDSCKMLELMLTNLSFMPTSVQSGDAAIKELERAATTPDENPYRLILMDWRMPDMNGLETARRIRNCTLSVYPEIIIISGYVTTDIQEDGRKLGIRAYLTKPFNLYTLLNGIMTTFGKENVQFEQQKSNGHSAGNLPIRLCDARVLLVEDDKVNQIVAQEIMRRFGAVVVTMDNGVTGVTAALGSDDFDMVFMDIQMPEMNGYEAATAIRQIKGELELPIIAMTAHAFSEERERCLAAGMNDHIAKPIDPDQLYSVMLKWLSAEKVKRALNSQTITVDTESPRIFPDSLPGIDVASVLQRCGGNETLAREIILSFREQNRNIFNELRCTLESGNSEHAKALLHTLKGLAGTIGAASLAATISELETALNEKNAEVAIILPAHMEQQLAEVFEAADILAGIPDNTTHDIDGIQLPKEELEQLLKELHDSLRNNSTSAKRLFKRLEQYLRKTDRDEIHKHIARLDFEMALAALERAAQFLKINLQWEV